MDTAAATPSVFYMLGYVFLLIAALAGINVLLTRLTRNERRSERTRRVRRPGSHVDAAGTLTGGGRIPPDTPQ